PPSLLPAGKEEEISKNLDKFSNKYEYEDQDAFAQFHEKERQNREMLQEEWDSCIKKWKKLNEKEKVERQKINGEASDNEAAPYEVELVEEFLDVREEDVVTWEFDHE
ncbi:hypothetical protein MKX03_024062, partial [Papaver bracteatum]